MTYDLSYMDNVTNPLDILVGTSQATGNNDLIGILILVTFFSIYLMMSYTNDFQKVLVTGSLLTFILGTLLTYTGLISQVTAIYPLVVLIISIVLYFMT